MNIYEHLGMVIFHGSRMDFFWSNFIFREISQSTSISAPISNFQRKAQKEERNISLTTSYVFITSDYVIMI